MGSNGFNWVPFETFYKQFPPQAHHKPTPCVKQSVTIQILQNLGFIIPVIMNSSFCHTSSAVSAGSVHEETKT